MTEARFAIRIDGNDYIVERGTFQEGSIRRQPEVITLQDIDLKSVPDTRQFWQTSWLGGAQWEQPVYNLQNLDTYYDAQNLSLTDRGGAIQVSNATEEIGLNATVASGKVIAWTRNGFDGAVAIVNVSGTMRWDEWDSSTDSWSSTGATYGSTYDIFAASGGTGDLVYAIAGDGTLLHWDTSGTTTGTVATGLTIESGTALWADSEWVWIYNGDRLYRLDIDDSYAVEEASGVVNDGWGFDVFAQDADFSGTPIIPEWSTARAITTSEGIFYVKNVYEGGLAVAKVFRVDRDASGAYILTPITTLPKGQVAINLTMHLSSLIITTVGNLFTALDNSEHQRVTLYHVTGNSVGAVGSPLGGTDVSDTPVWILGARNEQLYIGGQDRIWQYDGRLGSVHPLFKGTNTLSYDGAFTHMVTVRTSEGTGVIFVAHTQSTSVGMLGIVLHEQLWWNDAAGSTYLESNWFDFDLPMETKYVDEVFIDADDVRATAGCTVSLIADKEDTFEQVASLSSGDSVGHFTVSEDIAGYRFRYRIDFSDDAGTETSTPPFISSIGFKATAGEMVPVLQCTINGWESVNVENEVQDPKDVYDNMVLLRDNADPVVVRHWYVSDDASDYAEATYKVVSVSQRKDAPKEALVDVVLMRTVPSGRITAAFPEQVD